MGDGEAPDVIHDRLGAEMLKSIMIGALLGVAGALAVWRRDRERDAYGNPCLRYCGPRFGIPLVGLVFLAVGLYNLNDPFHQRHRENSAIEFGFALLGLAAATHFVSYRVSIRDGALERRAWPLKTVRYPMAELADIEVGENSAVLRFTDGRIFTVNPVLSGRVAFVDFVRSRADYFSQRASHRSADN